MKLVLLLLSTLISNEVSLELIKSKTVTPVTDAGTSDAGIVDVTTDLIKIRRSQLEKSLRKTIFDSQKNSNNPRIVFKKILWSSTFAESFEQDSAIVLTETEGRLTAVFFLYKDSAFKILDDEFTEK